MKYLRIIMLFLTVSTISNGLASRDLDDPIEENTQKTWIQSAGNFIKGIVPGKDTLRKKTIKTALVGLTIAQACTQVAATLTCPQEMRWDDFLREKIYGSYTHGYDGNGVWIIMFDEERLHYLSDKVYTPLESFNGMCKLVTDLNLKEVLYAFKDGHYFLSPNGIMRLAHVSVEVGSAITLLCNYTVGYPQYPDYIAGYANITCKPF